MHKRRVTIAHLLTHRAALVPTPTPLPYEQLGDLDAVVTAIGELDLIGEPGDRVQYSPALAHALMGEAVGASTARTASARSSSASCSSRSG